MNHSAWGRMALPAILVAVGLLVVMQRESFAQQQTAADLLPESTVIYAELARPQHVLDTVLDHPLRQKLESLDQYKEALERPEYLRFKAGLSLVEAEMEMPWRKLLEAMLDGGVYMGVDAKTQGAVLLVKARDEAILAKALGMVTRLAREDAQRKGQPDPYKTVEYRGITAYRAGENRIAACGSWLLMTNKDALGQQVIDNFVDKGTAGLASRPTYQAARGSKDKESSAWAFFDLEAIRALDNEQKLFKGPTDNPVGELLVGGIFAVLKHAPYATVSLKIDPRQAQVVASMPYQPQWVGESREYYFGKDGRSAAPPLLQVDGQLLSLSTYRDVSQMWLRADDLFDQQVNDNLAQADSNLSTLFSGKDFGEEILGSFGPELQVVVARQTFGDKTPQPAIKLPSFALTARMKDPQVMQPELRRIFMSLAGFLNVVGAMNGQPQLDFDVEKEGGRQLVASRYVPSPEEETSKEARINFNFSPTVGFEGPLFVLASTRQLAANILDSAAKNKQPAATEDSASVRVNSALLTDIGAVRDALADNREQLIAQNMLQEGNSRQEAETQIGLLLEMLGLLKSAEVRMESNDKDLQLKAQLDLAP